MLQPHHKKIAIIGCAGSGKTTLAFLLQKLNLPIYHLDQYYWKPNWERSGARRISRAFIMNFASAMHGSWKVHIINYLHNARVSQMSLSFLMPLVINVYGMSSNARSYILARKFRVARAGVSNIF